MRWIALALFLMVGALGADTLQGLYYNAACSPENSNNDGSGNNAFLQNTQTILFGVGSKEGTYYAYGFSGCCTSGQGSLISAMVNTSITAQAYVYFSSLVADQCIISWCNGGGGDPAGLVVTTGGNLKMFYPTGGAVTITAGGVITAGAWYYVAMHTGGDGNSAWVAGPNPTSGFTPTQVLSAAASGYTSTSFMQVGRWAPTGTPAAANMFIDSLSMRTGNIPTLPTAEMFIPPSGSVLSPYATQGLSPFVSPWRMFR